MGRITLNGSVLDAVVVMMDGNPGAVQVLGRLVEAPGGVITMLQLDDLGIYGPEIWMLYKDECGEDLDAFRAAVIERMKNRGIPAA